MSQDQQPVPYGQYPASQSPAGWNLVFRQPKPPVSGLRIAAGILGILVSLWVLLLTFNVFRLAILGFVGTVFPSVVFAAAALTLFVVGIIQITKSRSRGRGLPLTLVAIPLVVLIVALTTRTLEIVGFEFIGIYSVIALSLVVVALLAVLRPGRGTGS